jgi:hypothetical protein
LGVTVHMCRAGLLRESEVSGTRGEAKMISAKIIIF